MHVIKNYLNTEKELNSIKLRLSLLELYEKKIKEEKISLEKLSQDLEKLLQRMDNHTKELSGIENELYYQIVVRKLNVTKAVDFVAYKENKDPSTIWKLYYPKVKKKINELNSILSSESQVSI